MYKPLLNHILVVCWNIKGHGHGPLDFHAPTKKIFNLQNLMTKGLKTQFLKEEEVLT
jgi:hypothetical protein